VIHRYEIEGFGGRIVLWGNRLEVYAISLTENRLSVLESRFDKMSRLVITGKSTDPLPVALGYYLKTGVYDISLLPVFLWGTTFQLEVWKSLRELEAGEVITYGRLAEKIGRPGAARAVGNALRENPIPIVIPCHRVVSSTGIGGYAGGVELKRRLLFLDRIKPKKTICS